MLLSLKDRTLWDKIFNELTSSLQDIYYTSKYYSIYENSTKSEAYCYVYQEKSKTFFYPFLKSKINESYANDSIAYFDIEGAYGYNGALSNNEEELFLTNAANLFLKTCEEENIIAEFTRFNPVLKNHLYSKYFNPINVNQNIILDLKIENIWMDAYEQSTRKNINKAIRSGLNPYSVEGKDISKDELRSFISIYNDTMKRNNASESYYFNENYFSEIANLETGSKFYFTKFEDKIVSCELVLYGNEIVYSFLGGTQSEYFNLRANDILKHQIISESKTNGLKYFCLGGGTSLNDGIFKYKKCFAKNGVQDFFIGKKIHNKEVYETIVSNWEKINPLKKELYKNHLLKYKY
jgi:lipid II:glycine glycyltransferase (peptidoglycan interpeptide bridge formation enzyme)